MFTSRIVANAATAILSWFLFVPLVVMADQVIDPVYVPNVSIPEHTPTPIVLFDHGHNNFHRVDQRYTGVRDLLTADGYNVRSIDEPFVKVDATTGITVPSVFDREKGKGRILVIANACGVTYSISPCDTSDPALTDSEVSKIISWVRNGGSLLLIFDHTPYNHVANLTAALGINIVDTGYVISGSASNRSSKFDFTRAGGLNTNSIIANGRNANESIDHVRVFTGDAFRLSSTPPQDAIYQPLLTLQSGAGTSSGESVAGAYMGMAIQLGAGRVYVSGEAGMFSAQMQTDAYERLASYMGVNDPAAAYNAQYLRNIVHWLEGDLFDSQLNQNGPDLVVTALTGELLASTNTTFPFAYTVCNLGNVDTTRNVDMAVYLSQDSTITSSDAFVRYVTVPPLVAHQCISRTDTAYLPATGMVPGTYYLGSIVDYTDHVVESFEGNNTFTGATVTFYALPDLVVHSISGPATGKIGGTISVAYSVCNQGSDVASYSSTGLYLSSDPSITTTDYHLINVVDVLLAAGSCSPTNNVTVTIPSNIPPGTYYLGAIADLLSYIAESNENNNSLAGNTITISP
jgi:hypothetical protein